MVENTKTLVVALAEIGGQKLIISPDAPEIGTENLTLTAGEPGEIQTQAEMEREIFTDSLSAYQAVTGIRL